MKNAKVGNWVFITGAHLIGQDYWNKYHPRGIFGRIIKIDVRYSQFDGRRLMDTVWVRAYTRDGRKHYKTTYKYLKTL